MILKLRFKFQVFCLGLFFTLGTAFSFAQTNPAAFDLSSGNYTFNAWSAGSDAGMYPPNMRFHVFELPDPDLNSEPSGDWLCLYNISSRSRMIGLEQDGIGFINTGNFQDSQENCGNGPTDVGGYVGAAVVSLNATGRESIMLSFNLGLISQGAGTPTPREYSIRLQYRVGNQSGWIGVPGPVNFSSAGKEAGDVELFENIMLPATCNNQELVQVRWKYHHVASNDGGTRPSMRLDDILITSQIYQGGNPEIPELFVNEIMASNTSTIADVTGAFEDWFEIYNPNNFAVDITGFYLTDDLNLPTKHLISEDDGPVVVPANGFLLFWASDSIELGNTHTNFKLSASGESVGLFYSDGESAIDAYSFGLQTPDVSVGRATDGNSEWISFASPTPGASNGTVSSLNTYKKDGVVIYPNPVRDFIIIKAIDNITSISIFNLQGKVVINQLELQDQQIIIPVVHLNSGIYVIQIQMNDSISTQKFVKD